MDLDNCKSLVKKLVRETRQVSSKRGKLTAEGRDFRIIPDENFEFPQGHLLIEYERTKRPVESIAKYWWLFYRQKDWLPLKKKIVLILILLNSEVNEIRSESVKLLGKELEKRFPQLFKFFFISPDAISKLKIEDVIDKAITNLKN